MAATLPTPLECTDCGDDNGCCGVDCITVTQIVGGVVRTFPGNPNTLGELPTDPAVAEVGWEYDLVSGAYIAQWVWNPRLTPPQWA